MPRLGYDGHNLLNLRKNRGGESNFLVQSKKSDWRQAEVPRGLELNRRVYKLWVSKEDCPKGSHGTRMAGLVTRRDVNDVTNGTSRARSYSEDCSFETFRVGNVV